jgi:hypothetical protein
VSNPKKKWKRLCGQGRGGEGNPIYGSWLWQDMGLSSGPVVQLNTLQMAPFGWPLSLHHVQARVHAAAGSNLLY